ncbi:MAG: GH92 family glycosyl hydrolase [Bacteroidota bacterium]
MVKNLLWHINSKGMLPLLGGIALSACAPKTEPQEKRDVLQFVDPMIGTGFHGHTFPGPVVPHGQIQPSPDTHIMGWEASSGYHYDDKTLYGFSQNHLSGTGIGDLGDFLFLPFTGEVGAEKPVGRLDHNGEVATPGYYSIEVLPWDIKAELTVTERVSWQRHTYPQDSEAQLMIDLSHILQPNWGHLLLESEIQILNDSTITGYRRTSGWANEDPIWFSCSFDSPIQMAKIIQDSIPVQGNQGKGKALITYLSFGKLSRPLNVKVAISSVDGPGSMANLATLAMDTSFDTVVSRARRTWRQELEKIEITTKDTTILTNFYTALYHSRIAPMTFSDADGRYRGMDGNIHKKRYGKRYTAYSLWDVYRSWYPLMTLIDPDMAREWAYDIHQHAEEGGLLPKWPLNANYTGTMVGYPAVTILADALGKGLLDSLPERVLNTAVRSSQWQPEFHEKHKGTRAERVMPKHIYYKEKLGFVPMDRQKESVSYGLEMAYYDWCIARMAEQLGRESIATTYRKKAKAYEHYFDSKIGFMRGKNEDGSWNPNFNPRFSDHLKSPFVEGNSWQWTPFVPHDLKGLRTLMGGKEKMGVWLDSLFTTSSVIEGENASADITGLIGQYAHGNEPSHHVPFMYQETDRPWRTQEVLNTIMYDFYAPTPEGIIGNEDCGQMSAWYVLNALGLYQVTPGIPEFTIGRPLVDHARLQLPRGVFTMEVANNSRSNKYVHRVSLNGKALETPILRYTDIAPGNILSIHMGNTPKKTE